MAQQEPLNIQLLLSDILFYKLISFETFIIHQNRNIDIADPAEVWCHCYSW